MSAPGIEYVSSPPRSADLVIVGGGVIGAATAFHARRAGLRPLIVERRAALSTLTTAVATGGFRLQLDDELELPLVTESVETFLHFAEATGQRRYDAGVRQRGYLWLTRTSEGAERQRGIVEAYRVWGLDDVDLLGGDDARRLFPFVGPDVVQARFRAGDGVLDPVGVALGLAASSRSPVALRCSVTGFRISGDRLTGVLTSAGTVDAEAAVVAAGPFSGVVATLAGVHLPVWMVRRQKLVMPEVPEVPAAAPMVIDEDSGVHWRPALRGAYALYAEPDAPLTAPAEDVPTDHRFAFRVLDPASPVSIARTAPFWRDVWDRGGARWLLQAGQYTMTPDHRPLIGPTAVEGLYVNTGYSGRGVMGSVGGSRRLVDAVLGKLRAADNPFRPDRSFESRPGLGAL